MNTQEDDGTYGKHKGNHDGNRGIAVHTIEIRDLTKTYGDIRAVDGLSFTAKAGRITGFLGPNGAGKTTTLRMLLGLVRPESGTALIDGVRYAQLADPTGTVGALLDPTIGHPWQSARTRIRIIAAAAGRPDDRVDEVLDALGLAAAASRQTGVYSLGMRQRTALAAALLGDPDVLVLDEPANGLDPAGIRWLREELRRFADGGGCVLISSHQLAELARAVDDVVIIAHGQVRSAGPIEEIVGPNDLEETYLDLTRDTAGIR